MQEALRPTDRYGKPIQPGNRYRVTAPGRPSKLVRLYWSEDDVLMTEDLQKQVGENDRFMPVYDFHNFAEWVQVNLEGIDIEPDRKGRDCEGNTRISTIDQLAEIELRSLMCRHELQRLEHLACQVVGCTRGDGSETYDAVFDMIYNAKSAEHVVYASLR